MLGEPDIVVRSQRDPYWVRASRQRENRYGAAGGDASNEIGQRVGEPEIPICALGDLIGENSARDWERSNHPAGRDAANAAAVGIGVPEIAVGAGDDAQRIILWPGRHKKISAGR